MKTPRYLRWMGLLALTTGSLISSTSFASDTQKTLKLYNWIDYIAPDTLQKFESETGIKVVSDYFDTNEMLEAKLLTGRSGYDIVVPSFTFMSRQIKAGVFQPLDKSKLSNLPKLDQKLMQDLSHLDKDNQHGVPYLWGTTGIGYNVQKVREVLGEDAPVNSWELVFNPKYMEKLASCGVSILDTPDEIFPLALHYLGKDPYPETASEYKMNSEAAKLLQSIRPYVQSFNSAQYITDLADGNLCVAVGYSGDIMQAQFRAEEANKGVSIAYSIPNEGTSIWFDMLAIPKDSQNSEAAHQFINFVMRPDIMADITNYVAYPNANTEAFALIDPEISGNPSIYPTPEVKQRLFTQELRKEKFNRLLTRFWTKLKTNQSVAAK